MKKTKTSLFFLGVFFLSTFSFLISAGSVPLSPDQVPEPLKPWIDWVLKGERQNLCPLLSGDAGERECVWPSNLSLKLEEKGGIFTQSVWIHAESWVSLPGDAEHWPLEVKVDNAGAAVILREDSPQVLLKPGFHTLSGNFSWDSLPESLQVPPETALLQLILQGKTVDFPKRDQEGQLWLEGAAREADQEDRLEIRVHRLLTDEIPAILNTHILLNVSGKNREITLGRAVPDHFIPMSIQSPLPVRIEKDGSLKVQARAGNWNVEIKYRHEGPLNAVTLPTQENWAAEEVWAFQAENNLRLVSVEGVPSIDPEQTTLPADWKKLPAYRLKPGETLTLVEKRRGDADPAPDQLSLERQLWLDFDGKGYTLEDSINGTLNRSSRLEANPPLRLGRVSVDGKDQLITHLPGSPLEGVELNAGSLKMKAESRLPKGSSFSAVGWNHDFQSVVGTLHLPPGWRLFSVSGVDQVPETWLHQWSLLDLFLVLIIALSFAKLWGLRWGLFSLLMLTLTFTERGAPQWVWLAVLVGHALLRVISKGWLMKFLKFYRFGAVVVLLLISVPFMIGQIRVGLYPALEYPHQSLEASSVVPSYYSKEDYLKGGEMNIPMPGGAVNAPPAPPMMKMPEAPTTAGRSEFEQRALAPQQMQMAEDRTAVKRKKMMLSEQNLNLLQYQPGAKIQTGPGLPHWSWNPVRLNWSGPVKKDQKISLYLMGPILNLVLAFVRVGLLALLILCVFEFPGKFWPASLKRGFAGTAAAILVLSTLGALPREGRADFPSKEMQDELKNRLLENPECYPHCGSISRMRVEVTGNLFRAQIEAGTSASSAIALPGSAAEWFPQRVLVDGKSDVGLLRSDEGHLWLQLPPGAHQVFIEGALPDRDTVQITLPLKPYFVEAKTEGWSLSGLHEDGQADDNLQLIREAGARKGEAQSFQANNLPPFVRVLRQLNLGLTWEIETRIERLGAVGTAVVLEIPLLEGESVTTAGVRVSNGKVQVSMAPNAEEFSWKSVMDPREDLNLKAPQTLDWTEEWLLNASPIWHVEAQGIPPIHPENPEEAQIRDWQPWPGEDLHLKISRPEAVEGPTMTVEQSLLVLNPGLRATEITLTFQLKSSLGGQHTILLPEGAELQSVSINGNTQPIRQDKTQVTLPVAPGSQSFELKWNQPQGIKFFFKTPAVNLKLPSVNSEIQMNLGDNRWVLFVCGPRMGPAVLFWSLFIILVLAAWGLSRIPGPPLKSWHWILLGIGLSQIPVWAAAVVAGWLLIFAWRKKNPPQNILGFDGLQILLVIWTAVAVGILFAAIHQGLLGIPEMEIAGNGSSYSFLRWFQDRSPDLLPTPWLISFPMFVYRLAMLAWALWIAAALLMWFRWIWGCFGEGGRWRSLRVKKAAS